MINLYKLEQFQVGDIVEAFGVTGKVTNLLPTSEFPVEVSFELPFGKRYEAFTSDGKLYDWHQEPVLKFISRPKKKVRKDGEVWINIYFDVTTNTFTTREDADYFAAYRADCIRVPYAYEVEE